MDQSIYDRAVRGVSLSAKLTGVRHGSFGEQRDDAEATLATFEFRFDATNKVRFTEATVTIIFSYQNPAPNDPRLQVASIAPKGLFAYDGISVEDPTGSIVGGIYRSIGAKITGTIVNRGEESGWDNGAVWVLSEDKTRQEGIPDRLGVAVLLQRGPRPFKASVNIKASTSQGSLLGNLSNKLLSSGDNSICFDPAQPPIPPGTWDTRPLDQLDLSTLSGVTAGRPKRWEAKRQETAAGLAAPVVVNSLDSEKAISHTEVAELSTLQPLSLADQTLEQKLFQLAEGSADPAWYQFKRFDSLNLLNLYHYQHKLVLLDQKINKARGQIESNEVEELAKLLKEYHDALQMFKNISEMTRPEPKTLANVAQLFADAIGSSENGQHYRNAGDALHMVDLSPEALGVPADAIRAFLARRFAPGDHENNPKAVAPVSTTTFHQTEIHGGAPISASVGGVGGELSYSVSRYEDRRPPGKPAHSHSRLQISSKVDWVTRVLVSLVGGAFLLVPMVALTYITEQRFQLLTVSLFVVFFALTVALTTSVQTSNQELVAATAGYAAVLVVFISQTPALA